MLTYAEEQHRNHRPLTSERLRSASYGEIYGHGSRELATITGVKPKTIRTLRRMLGMLVAMAETGGSPMQEVFERFTSFDAADKRTRNARTTYNPWMRGRRQLEQLAPGEMTGRWPPSFD